MKNSINVDKIEGATGSFATDKEQIICEWKCDDDGIYSTSCGNSFVTTEGTLAENSFKYCVYCGRHIFNSPM